MKKVIIGICLGLIIVLIIAAIFNFYLKKDENMNSISDNVSTPRLILEYSYDGKASEFPLIFDGISGELLIEDNQVLNISMY